MPTSVAGAVVVGSVVVGAVEVSTTLLEAVSAATLTDAVAADPW